MKTKLITKKVSAKSVQEVEPRELLTDVRGLILSARQTVARGVNAALVALHWQIGQRIRKEILGGKRAEYGEEIVATLSRELGWSHFVELLPLKRHLQREFYAEMCRIERWSVRTLRKKIGGMLYERTALSRKPAKLAAMELRELREEDKLTPDLVFRDPYFLDFLGLKGAYSEQDLEAAILRDLEEFLVEMGGNFAFLARQKRIVVGMRLGIDHWLTWVERPIQATPTNPSRLWLDRRTRMGACILEVAQPFQEDRISQVPALQLPLAWERKTR